MVKSYPQFRLRLPLKLKEAIENSAKRNKRTLNAEVVDRLESTFAPATITDSPQDAENFSDALRKLADEIDKQRPAGFDVRGIFAPVPIKGRDDVVVADQESLRELFKVTWEREKDEIIKSLKEEFLNDIKKKNKEG